MVWQLIHSRLRNALHIKAFFKMRMRHHLREIEKDERGVDKLQKKFSEWVEVGAIENTQLYMEKLINKTKGYL